MRPLPHFAKELLQTTYVLGQFDGVEMSTFSKTPVQWFLAGRVFPLDFGRQSRASPASVRIRLEIADVCYRAGHVNGAKATERELAPAPSCFDQ